MPRSTPCPGRRNFLDKLRAETQVIILSDTFEQFAKPLMEKLNWPTIFCNTLEVGEDGAITGYKMRCEKSKLTTVKALQSMGYETIAAGDSFNDLAMIQASKAGFLFKSTDAIKAAHPELPAFEEFGDLLAAIDRTLDKGTRRVTIHLPYDKGGLLDVLYREAKVEQVEYADAILVTAVCTPKTLGRVGEYVVEG